jgi:3-hydroxyacyl-CoA dehydrogenase/enoyl-CoA hydratase/3-hydroxybutyryl-CoA epimerase
VLASLQRPQGALPTRTEVEARLVHRMVDEAYRILDEGLVDSEDDIDLALVMGIGFPPFTGGLTRWARNIGLAAIVESLERSAARFGERFAPSHALRARSTS